MCATASADHVEVREEREQGAVAASPARRDAGCRPCRSRLRATPADRLAHDVEGEVLVRRTVRARAAARRAGPGSASRGSLHFSGTCRRMTDRHIATDLLTPLGAYLRLRGAASASFLLESVEQGRLGPPLLHRRRLAPRRPSTRRRRSTARSSATSPTTTSRKLEPTVPLPVEGPDLPESRFVVADTLVRYDHGSGTAAVLAGDPDDDGGAARGRARVEATQSRFAGGAAATRRSRARRVRGRRSARSRSTSAPATRSRSCSRNGRNGRRRLGAPALPRAAACQPLAVPLPARARRRSPSSARSPETLVKCEDGRASLNPIAGTTQPGDGDAERLLASEKDRAEHVMLVDLGRNDLSRVCAAGQRPRRSATSSRSASRTSRTSSPRSWATCATA